MQRQKTSAMRAHLCRSVTRTPAPLETDYTTTTMAVTPEEQALAQPLAPEEVTLEAWYMDDDLDADQRLPHRCTPNQPVSGQALKELGVLVWRVDADNYQTDARLAAIRKARGYTYQDEITCSPDKLPCYEDKIKMFYQEHIHSDEEIRFVLDGSGYFDVRDLQDRWIRMHTRKGDLVVLPEGIYHRFTLDEGNYIHALRLFVGEPVWTPYNRPQEEHPSRAKYVSSFAEAA